MKEDPLQWQKDAACKGVHRSTFFNDIKPPAGKERLNFRDVCGTCPVKPSCLEHALIYNCKGKWGGLTEKERGHRYDKEFVRFLIEDAKESGLYIKELAV
jgi:WhiB family redox-sensing transcriptional regulator